MPISLVRRSQALYVRLEHEPATAQPTFFAGGVQGRLDGVNPVKVLTGIRDVDNLDFLLYNADSAGVVVILTLREGSTETILKRARLYSEQGVTLEGLFAAPDAFHLITEMPSIIVEDLKADALLAPAPKRPYTKKPTRAPEL